MLPSLTHAIPTMRVIKKLGHITPSCNTVLEPLTTAVASPLAHKVSHHFTRIAVGSISLTDTDRRQFDPRTMVSAARLLADACIDVVVWNGTSGCWNGIAADIQICEDITEATGLAASTTTLALVDVLDDYRIDKFALAVPYTDDVTAKTIDTFAQAGYSAVSRANLGLAVGRDMANIPFAKIKQLIHDADSPEAQCVVVVCTGLPAAFVVEEMEQELGKPIFDSVLATLWKGLQLVDITDVIWDWGCLMRGGARDASAIGAVARTAGNAGLPAVAAPRRVAPTLTPRDGT